MLEYDLNEMYARIRKEQESVDSIKSYISSDLESIIAKTNEVWKGQNANEFLKKTEFVYKKMEAKLQCLSQCIEELEKVVNTKINEN